MAEFRLLGAVEIWAAGRQVDAGQPRQRVVLAALLVDAGRLVVWDALVDRVWGPIPPARARQTLYSHVARIRQLLNQAAAPNEPPARLIRRPGGYELDVDPQQVDVHRFQGLIDRARDPDRVDVERVALLREALALWRGEPLAGLSGPWADRVRDGWRQRRLDAVLAWAQAELQVGNPAVVIGSLTELLGEHPLLEPLAAALMRALCAAGRSADALDCYTATRRRLVDELGNEPGTELARLQHAILRPDLDQPAPPAGALTIAAAVPAQLPPDVHGFAGRRRELAQLDDLLTAAGDQSTAVVISALSGTAGVGKTALALHWAHRVRDRFPDGQLYVNLRGFDPSGRAMSPAEAVRGFLDAFGVPTGRIPAGVDAQVGLYRSLLAGRRVLVVLDNARDAGQTRPLLPGEPGCLVLVTSRSQLTSLVAAEGAHPLILDLLTAAEARQLLAGRVGAGRVTAEPHAVDEIITRCARLPLALAVVGARAATHVGFPLEAMAGQLRGADNNLDAFNGGDSVTDVRGVSSWSYQALSAEAAALFRLLGLHPGPDIGEPAVASLAGVSAGAVRPRLGELADAHLITEHAPGRYALHDLLRAYATELAAQVDTDPERREAVHRVLDYYLAAAAAAMDALYPAERHHRPPVPFTDAPIPPMVDPTAALAWLDAERPNLVVHERQGRHAQACEHHRQALTFFRGTGDRAGEADALGNLGAVHGQQGRHEQAIDHYDQALTLHRQTGNRAGEAEALNGSGEMLCATGQPDQARTRHTAALALAIETGYYYEQARAHNGLAHACHSTGEHDQARNHWQHAVTRYTDLDVPEADDVRASLATLDQTTRSGRG